MKRLILILAFSLALYMPAFAEWEIEYEKNKSVVYIYTINTNQGEAWFIINTSGDNITMFMQFQDMYLSSENVKIEYKLNAGDSKFITGKRDREKLIVFSSSRNHDNTIDFLEKLKESTQLSIKFNDGYKKSRTFIFDVSGLESTLEKVKQDTEPTITNE